MYLVISNVLLLFLALYDSLSDYNTNYSIMIRSVPILMHKSIYLLLYTEQTMLTCNQECSYHRSVVQQNRSKVKEKHSRHVKCTQILGIADTFCQMKKTNMKETWKHSHGLTNVSRSTHNTKYFYTSL